MKLIIKILVIGIILAQSSYGQINNDTIYGSLRLVSRFGLNIQKAYGLEIGLLINFGNTSLKFKPVLKPNKNHSQSKN